MVRENQSSPTPVSAIHVSELITRSPESGGNAGYRQQWSVLEHAQPVQQRFIYTT